MGPLLGDQVRQSVCWWLKCCSEQTTAENLLKPADAVALCGLDDFQKVLFSSPKKRLPRRLLKALSLVGGTFVFARLPLQPEMSLFHPGTQTARTHLAASKVAAWCLTEQHMSLVVPVSGSLSCQLDLRWQTCGRLSYPRRGVLCQML